MTVEHLLPFLAAVIVLNVIPGPDMLVMAGQSLSGGQRAGLLAVLGVSAGLLLHASLAVIGLGQAVASSPKLFLFLQLGGAGYIIWLGFAGMSSRAATATVSPRATSPFRLGFVVNATNPKILLFFFAFLPTFVDAAQPLTVQLLLLTTLFIISSAAVGVAVVLVSNRVRSSVLADPEGRFQVWSNFALLAVGAWLLIRAVRGVV